MHVWIGGLDLKLRIQSGEALGPCLDSRPSRTLWLAIGRYHHDKVVMRVDFGHRSGVAGAERRVEGGVRSVHRLDVSGLCACASYAEQQDSRQHYLNNR